MTAATPNEPEVEAALGISIGNDAKKLEWAGRTLMRKLKHNALLITRGKDGMALFERGKKTTHIPIHGSDETPDIACPVANRLARGRAANGPRSAPAQFLG